MTDRAATRARHRGSVRRGARAAALLVASCLVAGCGARLTENEMRSAVAGESAGLRVRSPATDVAPEPGSPSEQAEVGAPPDDGGRALDTTTGQPVGTPTSVAGAAAGPDVAAAPAGGNGGATDVGVTATTIDVGQVTTLTGPVPGLFRGVVIGAQAYFAMVNSQGGVFGRKIRVQVADDQFSADQFRARVIALTPKVLSFVGSFSLFDDAAAGEMRRSGIPDVGMALTQGRIQLPTNFSPQPVIPGYRLGPYNWFKQRYGDEVIKKTGVLLTTAGGSPQIWRGQKAALESIGYEVVYERAFQPTETDFTADVVQMKGRGVELLLTLADAASMARVARAASQQNWKPKLPIYGANAYDPAFVELAGGATEGTTFDMQTAMFAGEDADVVPEVALFNRWTKRIEASYGPELFGAYGWAGAKLFTQALRAAGPKLTRAALLDQLRTIDDFDAGGMFAPSGPASKRPPICFVIVKVERGKFVRADPATGFRCNDGGYFRLR